MVRFAYYPLPFLDCLVLWGLLGVIPGEWILNVERFVCPSSMLAPKIMEELNNQCYKL
jgi:hypothetical protein